jgi:ankyrin repeat protein
MAKAPRGLLRAVLCMLALLSVAGSLSAQEPQPDGERVPSLAELCRNSGKLEQVAALLEAGADWRELTVEAEEGSGKRVISGNVHRSYATLLMDYGMPVDIRDSQGRTFLMWAADYSDTDLVLALLDPRGKEPRAKRTAADPNLADNDGETALMKANRSEIIRLLLLHGADPRAVDHEGENALHKLNYYRGTRTMLARAGADVNAVSREGLTPLMAELSLSYEGHETLQLEKIDELLALGADPFAKTPDGKNLLLFYLENHSLHNFTRDVASPAVVKRLLDLGIEPAEADDEGSSALVLALRGEKECEEAVEIRDLLAAAVDKKELAAAKKEVRRENWHEFTLDAPDKLKSSAVLLIPLGYLAFSIASRESLYKDNPCGNWMVNVNTFTVGFVAGAAASSIPFFLWGANESGWDKLGPALIGLFVVPAAGIIAGGIMAANPRVRQAFADNPALYYLAPAFAGAVSIPIFIHIWRK